MKYLLITLLLLGLVSSSNNQKVEDKDLLISRTDIYLTTKEELMVIHKVLPPYFTSGDQVEYKLFEKFVQEHAKDVLLLEINRIKSYHDSLSNAYEKKRKI